MNFELVHACRGRFSVDRMCRALGVSRSGYYAWKTRPACDRQHQNKLLALHIRAVHNDTDATHGTPPITKVLKEAGLSCSRNRVARIKQEIELRVIAAPSNSTTTHEDTQLWDICATTITNRRISLNTVFTISMEVQW